MKNYTCNHRWLGLKKYGCPYCKIRQLEEELRNMGKKDKSKTIIMYQRPLLRCNCFNLYIPKHICQLDNNKIYRIELSFSEHIITNEERVRSREERRMWRGKLIDLSSSGRL